MAEPKVSILITAKDLATKVVEGVKSRLTAFGASMKSVFSGVNGLLAGLGIAGAGAALSSLFTKAMEEAASAERATLTLKDSVERLGLSYDALEPKISDYVNAQARAAALDNDDVAVALATLIDRSHDLTGSMENLNAVLGLAAKEHMDLNSAADIVGRAMNGQTRGLKALGITTKDSTEALAQLRAQYGGFAEQEAQSFEGMQRRIANAWNNLLEAMGTVIAESPVVRQWMDNIAGSVERATTNTDGLAGAFDTFVTTLSSVGSAIKILVLIPLAAIATAVLPVASAIRLIGAAFAEVWVLAGQAINGIIGGMNKIRQATALPGRKVELIAPIDLSGATKLRDAWAKQAVTNVKEIGNAWTAAGDAIGGALANAALADERARARREGRPVTGRAGGRTQAGAPRPRGGTGDGGGTATDPDKAERAADQARQKEAQSLLELLRLRELDAAGRQRLSVLQAELTREVERERAAVESGHGSYERLAALEKQRHDLSRAVHQITDEQRSKELSTLTQLLELRKLDGEGLGRLLELQRELTAAVKEEAERVRQGVGDRERLLELLKQQAEVERTLGAGPPKVTDGTNRPQPAGRITVNPRDQQILDEASQAPGDALPEWLKRVQEGWEGITEAERRANGEAITWGDTMLNLGGGVLGSFGSAAQAVFEQIGNGSQAMGKAFGNAIRNGIADAAKAKGRFYFAEGIGALAAGLWPPNPAALASSAKYFAAAAAMFALGNIAGGGASGGSGGGGSAGQIATGGVQGVAGRDGRPPVTIFLPDGVSVFDPSDPRTVDAWRKMFEDLTDRDVIITARGSR